MPNKSESDSLFDVIFFGPMFSAPLAQKPENKSLTKNVTTLSLTFEDGFQVSLKKIFYNFYKILKMLIFSFNE
jgi:hypothetical protein